MSKYDYLVEDLGVFPQGADVCTMIDAALSFIERKMDPVLLAEVGLGHESEALRFLADMSLTDKIDALIPEGIDELEEEEGSQFMWGTVSDLVGLRKTLDPKDAVSTVSGWLQQAGLHDVFELPPIAEPLRTELNLKVLLETVCTYLEGWLEVERESAAEIRAD